VFFFFAGDLLFLHREVVIEDGDAVLLHLDPWAAWSRAVRRRAASWPARSQPGLGSASAGTVAGASAFVAGAGVVAAGFFFRFLVGAGLEHVLHVRFRLDRFVGGEPARGQRDGQEDGGEKAGASWWRGNVAAAAGIVTTKKAGRSARPGRQRACARQERPPAGCLRSRAPSSCRPLDRAGAELSSMRRSWLYFATRSCAERAGLDLAGVVATAMSAIVTSSVSPERWLMTAV